MRILLIDDDSYWCRGFVEYAQLVAGWEILPVASPLEGLETLRRECDLIDGVLLDVMMPPDEAAPEGHVDGGLSTGLHLVARLLLITEGRIPIIVLSSRQDISGELQGVAAILTKLLPTVRLIEEIESILESAAKARSRETDA